MESHYASRPDVIFYALNCDDDETLVKPFLADAKLKTPALFVDWMDRLLRIESFPTTVVLDRGGKIAFRQNGFDPDGFEKALGDAIERVAQGTGEGASSSTASGAAAKN